MTFSLLVLACAIVWIVLGTTRFKLHPFLVLLTASIFLGVGTGVPLNELAGILGKGMGKTMQSIGLLILFGTTIGVVLEASNATQSIAKPCCGTVKTTLPYAVSCIGYLVAIPVFCDSAFVILSSLNKRLSQQTKTPLVALTVALSTGLFAPHVLVPPTPGPLAAAANLELENLFLLILFGGILALLLVLLGAAYAHYLSKKIPFEVENLPLEEIEKNQDLPSFGSAIAPIIIPIVLMALGTVVQFIPMAEEMGFLNNILLMLCAPSFALGIGMLLSFRLLKTTPVSLSEVVEKGIQTAAPILIITAMGGTLGLIIQQLPLTEFLQNELTQNSLGVSFLPFLLAAALKTAQGSSTVAIITASSIVFPLLGLLGLDSELGKVWVILAVGVGSMTISHANDSYFWIVSQMGGMDIKTAYRNHSFATFLQGAVGILLVLVGHWIFSTILA